MFAVIKTGGKQYIAVPGKKLTIEKIEGKEGDNVEFNEVILIEKDGEIQLGQPLLKGAKVSAKISKIGKGEKIHVLKYKSKSRYSVTKNHRQWFCEVEILSIS